MSDLKPLIIDKRNRVKGLFTYCQKCQRNIENRECGDTGKRLSTCKSTEKHMFKSIVAIPGTNGKKRKTRVFKTRDLNKAIELKIEFEKELLTNEFQSTDVVIENEQALPTALIECMGLYLAYLNNEGVETHKVKVRTRKHINEVEYYFEKFCKCLKKNGIDHTFFKVNHINDKIVALFHSYLLDDLNYANKTYNKIIALFRQFLNWLISAKKYDIENPFIGVNRRKVISNKSIVTFEEFQILLDTISPEKGFKYYQNGKRRFLFRPWLNHAFRLALETGLRREEFMTLKFSDVLFDENGKPQFIKVQNFKVNRIKGFDSETGEYKYVPVTKGLEFLLSELGLHQKIESEEYLIGENEISNRDTLIQFVSKAFTHFWQQTGIEKNVQLKHLRKTYLTALVAQFGEKAPIISGHSGINVLKKHYVNDKQLIDATRSFAVYK